MASCNSEDKERGERKTIKRTYLCPSCSTPPPPPGAAGRGLILYCVFVIFFFVVVLGPQLFFFFNFYECQRRPPAPSYGTSFCCPSDPTGRISPGPGRQRRSWWDNGWAGGTFVDFWILVQNYNSEKKKSQNSHLCVYIFRWTAERNWYKCAHLSPTLTVLMMND